VVARSGVLGGQCASKPGGGEGGLVAHQAAMWAAGVEGLSGALGCGARMDANE
jgi:hypothetical protein